MNTEQKAQRYDEALEKARQLCAYPTTKPFISDLQDIFPELKESEDERIRKALINGFNKFDKSAVWYNGITNGQILAWLEKQGETDRFIKEEIECIKGYRENAIKKLEELEKQGGIDNCPLECSTNTVMTDSKKNQVEPKFKVGDWITDGEAVFHITSYSIDYGYQLETPKGTSFHFSDETVEKKYHLWTIQDAKEGDVLYHKAENGIEYIVMSKGLNEHNNIDSYFRYNSIDGFGIDIPSVLSAKYDSITPATKEQRDTLFTKMKEAGYEWDSEKKELKKIEQPKLTAFEEEVKDMMDDYRDAIDDNNATVEEVKERAAYLLSLIPHKSAEWSEEDERICRNIVNDIANDKSMRKYEISKGICDEQINWLKSLKDRVQPIHEYSDTEKQEMFIRSLRPHFWRPSEEQMEVLLSEVTAWTKGCPKQKVLESLYNDLKKLKT